MHLPNRDPRMIHQIHTGTVAHQPAGRGELPVNDRAGTLLGVKASLTTHRPRLVHTLSVVTTPRAIGEPCRRASTWSSSQANPSERRNVESVGHEVLVIRDDSAILVADKSGEGIYEHTRPAPGIAYVGSGRPCGPKPNTPKQSPMS